MSTVQFLSLQSRGPLMSARQIRNLVFAGSRSERWICRHVAPKARQTFGHSTVRWYERDVVAWLDSARGETYPTHR